MTWPGRMVVAAIAGYQRWFSPLLPPTCRFAPTCSEYARSAIEERGACVGTWLAVRRLARCHPFHPGGFDPPPPRAARG